MTPQQIQIVQSTFQQIKPHADGVAQRFYQRLFELDPALRPMFKGDMARQRGMLMAMLGTAVNGLGNIAALLPQVQALGARHTGYGVTQAHYRTVGNALIDTLALGLGEVFTPGVREAWTAAYSVLAGAMQSHGEVAVAA